jgi:hypothetical protein
MKNDGFNQKALVFVGLGFELAAVCIGAVFLGNVIDTRYHTQGLATGGMIIVFFAGWVVHLVVLLKRFNEDGDS